MSKRRDVPANWAAACCLFFFVFEVTQVNITPQTAFHNLPRKWFFSALLDAHSAPLVLLWVCTLPSFHVEIWMLAFFFFFLKTDIECQAFQAFAKCIYLATCQPKGEFVVANVTGKGNWQRGSFSEVFQACAMFCQPPFSSRTCHACKCYPVTGHRVLTNFIPTNCAKVIEVVLKVLKPKKKEKMHLTCEHFITETVTSPSLFLTHFLSQLNAFLLGLLRVHYSCAHSSNSITSMLLAKGLKMSRWLSVSGMFLSSPEVCCIVKAKEFSGAADGLSVCVYRYDSIDQLLQIRPN